MVIPAKNQRPERAQMFLPAKNQRPERTLMALPRLYFLACTLEEISCAICITYFLQFLSYSETALIPKTFPNQNNLNPLLRRAPSGNHCMRTDTVRT